MNKESEIETAILEIIELADGGVVLQRADDQGLPLVKIQFSAESERMLAQMKMAVASAMIEAGMRAFAEMNAMVESVEESAILH